ncbi:PAS domain-containing sensor histidine kinase [Haloarcula salina]|uniref:histidine kinase n=1 Tax=Haloarcula salina TaxID=1429914 RepID=A0AA41G284_9EURY|nr:PAS domain-containing sensor histidine kinase [Haloarcula salina]MBV0902159.1 PAS domain-containing sensor histidine kinase [Haloarcula salina]
MSDDQGDQESGEPLFEQSQRHVQVLFDHERNGDLLEAWLGETYTVETPTEPSLKPHVDLCLVDAAAFARHREAFDEWKRRSSPVFAPVLLVSEERVNERFDPADWQTIDGLYIIDDVVSVPVEKPVLHRRMENLLERRTLSQTLDSRYRHSEGRFSSLFATLPDPAFVADADGTLVVVNDAFRAVADIASDDAEGAEVASVDCFAADAARAVENCIDAAIAERPPAETEARLTTPDGQTRYVSLNADAVAVDGEQVVTVVLRDVSERKRVEAELRESEQRFRRIAENLDEMIWMLDEDGDLLYVSSGYENLTGRSSDDLAAETDPLATALDHVHRADAERVSGEFDAMLHEVAAGAADDAYHFEYRLRHADGTTRWAEASAYPVPAPHDASTRIVGIVDDITARKRRERELERQNARLEEFAGIVSHDLRNPLQVIDARLDLLDVPQEQHGYVEAIERATGRMERLIEDLLTLAREGETVSERRPTELDAVARRAWRTVNAPESSLRVEDDGVVEADASRLQQLFENLFRNSVEHGGPAEDLTVRVGTLGDGFYVEDTGPGIPADQQDRVFERGYSTQDNGTGFGLNIVDDIAAAHGWSIIATDTDEDGARFEVTGVSII